MATEVLPFAVGCGNDLDSPFFPGAMLPMPTRGAEVNIQEAVTHVFQNYATFDGRARRSEFWNFALFNFCVQLLVSIILTPAFGSIVTLAVMVPSWAVGCRRLHDTGRSGWWQLLSATGIGAIVVLIWLCQDSQPGSNQYGPNPKQQVRYLQKAPGPQVNPQQLTCIAECTSGVLQGQTFVVDSQGVVFGRDPSCCKALYPVDTRGVSGRHCRLSWNGSAITLTDLGSQYGTILSDNRKLLPNYQQQLSSGDQFFLGSWENGFRVSLR